MLISYMYARQSCACQREREFGMASATAAITPMDLIGAVRLFGGTWKMCACCVGRLRRVNNKEEKKNRPLVFRLLGKQA